MSALWPHIACFVDESDASVAALAHAARLRAQAPGRLSVVHIAYGPPREPPAAPAWLKDAAAGAGGEPVLVTNLGAPPPRRASGPRGATST